jgi:hypothetical protein
MSNAHFTKEECERWYKEKTRNPRTGRRIDPNAKRGVYKLLDKSCTSETLEKQKKNTLEETLKAVKKALEKAVEKNTQEETLKAVKKAVKKVVKKNTQEETLKAVKKNTKQNLVTKSGSSPQDKYCRCLMHVRVPKSTHTKPFVNAYGICTKSVLHKYNVTRPEFCDYKLDDFTTEELLAYGFEYETRKAYNFRLGSKARGGDREALLTDLAKLQKFLRAKGKNNANANTNANANDKDNKKKEKSKSKKVMVN